MNDPVHFLLVPDRTSARFLKRRIVEERTRLGVVVGTWLELMEWVRKGYCLPLPSGGWTSRFEGAACSLPDAFWTKSLEAGREETLATVEWALVSLLQATGPTRSLASIDTRRLMQRGERHIKDLVRLHGTMGDILPDDLDLAARVRRLSGHYRGRGQELETLANPYGVESLQRWVSVPPIPMRPDIVRDTHEATGHVGRAKLAEALLAAYWWPGLRAQVAREVARCPMC